jgi:tetratricopeptide (TPR) repeat protein
MRAGIGNISFLLGAVVSLVFCGGGHGQTSSEPPLQAEKRFDEGKQLMQAAEKLQQAGKEAEAIQRFEDAGKAFDEAIQLGSKDHHAYLYRARCTLAAKKYDVAIEQFTRFIEDFGVEKSCRY